MEKLDKKNIEDVFALTPMQEGLLFHYLKDLESEYYFEQLSLDISGEINVQIFEAAWNFVIKSNEMLRAVFRWEEIENPIQLILKEHKLHPRYYDFSSIDVHEREKRLERVKANDKKQKNDLRDVPFRVTLCKIEKSSYEMIISNHHILYDGWSNGIILKEFFSTYNDLSDGKELQRPVKTKFKEFVKWNQNRDIKKQERFWREYLKDYAIGIRTPVNAQRRKIKKIKQTSCCRFKFPGEMSEQIKAFVKIHKLTLFSLLCSAWGLLLQKYNSTEDIVYDTTVSGRSAQLKGIENIVGLFINTLPMRVNTYATENITGFLSRMYAALQKREEFESSSLVNIKEYLEANTPHTLFDSVVILENYPLDKQMMQWNENKPGQLSLTRFSFFERTNYDLTVVITAFDGIEACITYNADIFDEDLVARICGHFVDIVKIFIENPSGNAAGIHIPIKEERVRILKQFEKIQSIDGKNAADQYVAPRDKIEERLAEVWSSVLKVEKSSIGIGANFFDFGGHSLKASVLAAKIHKEFNVKIALAQVFKHPTLETLAGYIKSKLEKIREDEYLSIGLAEKREYYELSSAQKQFYILQQMHPDRDILNMPAVITFGGDIEKEMLEKTFQQLIKRHESLRTSFIIIDNKPVQRVHDDVEFAVQYYDAPQVEVENIHRFIRPFDLSKAPLMRVQITSIPGRENILLIDIHHIVSDGASQQVLARDFTTLILGEELPPLRVQYKEFCRWQEHSSHTGRMKEHEKYWLNRLGGTLPKLNLPTDYPRPSVPAYTGHTIRVTLPVELTRDLYALIRRTGTTLYILLLAAFDILLYKYTGQTDIIIGSPTARRDHVDMEDVVGLVMGGVMMRISLHEDRTILEFLGEVKESTLEVFEHQEYPYEKLVTKLTHQDDSMGNLITPVRLNVQNMFDPGSLGKYRLQPLEQFSYAPDTSKLDLTITALAWGERSDAEVAGITLEFEYSTELFKPGTLERMSGRFQQLLQEIVENPQRQLWEIDMIPLSEKQGLTGSAPRCLTLSHAQKRIYYTEKAYPGTGCNTLAFSVRYGEILDKELLEAAIHTVIFQHEGLRLRIVEFESTFEPYQYIAPYEKEPLDSIELIGTNQGEDILELLDRKTLEPFKFFNSRLYYFAYIRFNRQESGYYIKQHHIISDIWTFKLLIEEIDTLYGLLRAGQPIECAAKPSYIQYIRDEKAYLHSRQAQEDRQFWHRTLLPLPEVDPLLFKDRNLMDVRGGVELLTFPTGLRNRLHLYCKEHNTTLFKLIFAGLSIYMARTAGNGDIAVGSAGHNRSTPLHKQTAGMFVSTIPFRVRVEEELSFADFIKKIDLDINHIVRNRQKYPFDLLMDEIKEKYRQDLLKLLDVNLVGHGDIRAERFKIHLHFRGYESSPIAIHINYSNLDIHGVLQLEYFYQQALFSPAEIRDIHRGIVNILDDSLEYPGKKIDQVEWITDKEKQRILFQFNDTEKPYPLDKTFPERFREQVEKEPDNIALRGLYPKFKIGNSVQSQNSNDRDSEHHLSYRELAEKSDGLAGVLQSKGVEPNTIVGIMMKPSVEMIIGLLGILKAGGAYLPIEPGYPGDRIEYMFKDSGAKILLTGDSSYLSQSPGSSLPRFPTSLPDDLAYVIYTSGSTGRPKGVLVEHGNLMAYLTAFENQFNLTADDTVVQQASFVFDAFVEELYPILLKGGVLAIPGQDGVKDIVRLVEFMIRHRVTLITASPLLLNELNKIVAAGVIGLRIRIYISGGDVLNTRYIDAILKIGEVYNTYGPTESTVCASYYKCRQEVPANVPIGKPIANYKLYILDKKKRLLPIGIGGELCVSGPGVTRGYLNNPELTAQKFQTNNVFFGQPMQSYSFSYYPNTASPQSHHDPFSSPHSPHSTYSPYSPIYRTGDLSRWLENGNIQFLGRIDTQVKIRGFRIELGEIELRLLQYPGIKDVVVTAREDRDREKYLCAYIAAERDIRIPGVHEYLSGKFPDYMIPAYFVRLDKIPLTVAGKVDRRALPEPAIKKGDNYIAPRDEVERKLAKIWADVLQINEDLIGSEANFFQLGGHSLKAIILTSRINKVFHINVPLKKIFTTPTIKGVSEYIKSKEEKPYASIKPVEKKDYYVLSSTQKRLYILHQMDESSTSYNMPYALQLEGDVNKNKLEEIFLRLISRHLSLRTSFRMLAGVPVQRICDEVGFEIEYKEVEVEVKEEKTPFGQVLNAIGDQSPKSQEPRAKSYIHAFIRPFNLSRAPLLRVRLIKENDRKHILMVDMHHIISDGISRQLLVEEFMSATGKDLPALRLQYKDFSEWQSREAQREVQIKQKAYWKKELTGEIPVLDLPCDYVRPTIQRFEGSNVAFELDQEEKNALQSLALSQGATLYMILLAIYYILLSKLSNQEDILVGTPTAGRRHADLQQIIGMFVNTLVLRNYPTGDKTYREFLKEIKKRSLQAFENQDYPFEELVENVAIDRDASRNPLFDVMFVIQNMGSPSLEIPGLDLTPYEHHMEISKFDLTLFGVEVEEKLLLKFEYSTGLFKKSTIERLVNYLKKIVSSVVDNPDVKIYNVKILEEQEKRQVLYDFNNTAARYPRDKFLARLFEKQAEKTPDNIAVIGPAEMNSRSYMTYISYRELNNKSNQLAYRLQAKGVEPDSIIGIMEERSLEMIVGILAILKAGGVYLPIDPAYPSERRRFMLDDCNAYALLTSSFLLEGSDFEFKGEIFSLDDMGLYSNSGKELDGGIKPEAFDKVGKPAYIMYTSGSTGRPKGVLVQHRNVVRLVVNTNYVELTAGTRILQTGAPVFDATTFEIWGALLNCGQLVLVEKETILEAHRLGQALKRNKINTLWLTSPLFNQLATENHEIFSTLDYLLVGGDVLSPRIINLVRDKNKTLKIINGYGPTENTTFSTTFQIDKNFEQAIPIGRPINNSTAFILDRYGRLQPVGIFGELWVGGDGVSKGYLNNPELTAEKFVELEVKEDIHHKSYRSYTSYIIYKTGDLARWLPDGNIEFSGRMDHQVKIRGFRIELSEVENYLLKHHAIKETIVIAQKDENEDKYLCAYIVSDHELSISQLRNYLSKDFPGYMIPSYFVTLEALPLTPNGKVDRKALPKPERKELTADYIPPQNLAEKKLVDIWSEVLGIKENVISMNSDFFQLGGHSLKATILASKIHKAFNVKVPLSEIFTSPTIRKLSVYIESKDKERYASIEEAEKKAYYRLSSAQKRLYLLHRIDPTGTAYNIPSAFRLDGIVDKENLETAFRELIYRHESFRTSFEMVGEEAVQRIHDQVAFEIEYDQYDQSLVNCQGKGEVPSPIKVEKIIRDFISPFDLSQAPLLRVGLIKLQHAPTILHRHPRRGTCTSQEEREDKYLLLVDIHHIISDGTSMGVLVKEFMQLYNGEELPPLRIQYKDFSRWQNSKKEQESSKGQERYWVKEFAGETPVLNLPVDFPRPAIQGFSGRSLSFEIGKEETQKLKNLAMTEGTTLYMVLLAIFNIFLARISGQEEIVVGSPAAGRGHADLERIIGMFVNTLTLKNYLPGEKTVKELIREVKKKTLEAQENQDYPFEELVENVAIDRDASRNPLFDVMFILQNIDIEKLEIPGLKLEPYLYENGISKFDITLYCEEAGEHLDCSIEYCTGLFKEETIERMIGYFKKITAVISGSSHIGISGIEIIPEEEKKQILFDFNDTETVYPGDKTIPGLFEQQAEKTPDYKAVSIKNHQLTYRELKKNTNGLAHLLRTQGIKPNNMVGVIVKRSLEMVIGIMAILKAGGAYLPIEPEYPEERIRFMLENSESKILLTPGKYSQSIFFTGEIINVQIRIDNREDVNLEQMSKPEDLLYLIYTSGSTGRPKGSMVKIRSFTNLLNWYTEEFNIDARDNILLMASMSFDLAQKNLFSPLIKGAQLCLPSCGLHHYDELSDTIAREQITLTNCAPSVFYPLLEFNLDSDFVLVKSLREVFLGGESIQADKLSPWINSESCRCEIVNTYGPTECTDIASFYRIKPEDIKQHKNIPIGKPIHNVKLFVLDKNQLILPVGIAGELCIGGISLGKGYYNNVPLTGERFVEVLHLPGKKVYRTGDLTRWLPDGNIELLGRIDQQIKIRGFRIEPGEIESQLRKRDEIEEAVVLAKEDKNGEKYLCAYIVLRKELDIPELRGYLSQHLPDFMIPSYFNMVDKIPLTPNGKIDRQALPEPDLTAVERYSPPRNQVEEKLVELWSEVLEVEKSLIGIDTNFFELGGHSLKVNSLLMKIHRTFDVKLPMAEVFKTPRIRGLAQCIKGLTKHRYESIEPVEKKDYYLASSTQKRLYILQEMESGQTTSYNMPYVIPLEKEIDKEKLEAAFAKLIARHESLRTSFELVPGEPVQRIHDRVDFSIHNFGLGVESKKVEEIIANFESPFDLSRAPLLRVGLIKVPHTPTASGSRPSQEGKGDKYLLLVDMHHIITDDASQNILEQEFWALAAGQELGPLRLHYKDFSEWQNSRVQEESIQQQAAFWAEEFSHDDQMPVLNLPTDYPRPAVQNFEGSSIHFVLTPQETRAIRDMAREIDATLFMCLLSIYTILLAKLSAQEDIIVGIPIAARRHADMEHIIGMFANTLAMRNYPPGEKTFKEFLLEVKRRTLKAFENQEYPFEELVEKVRVPRDISRNPIFDVMFNLLNPSELNEAIDMPVQDEPGGHRYEHRTRTAKFDLNLTAVDDNGERLYFDLEYCTKLFKADTIERMAGYFRRIAALLPVNPELQISGLEIITEEEKAGVLEMSNGVEEAAYIEQTVHRWYETQVEKRPDSVALVGLSLGVPPAGHSMGHNRERPQSHDLCSVVSFKALNEKSNQLANVLTEKGVTADTVVGLMVERSVEMIIAILAILKAGGAYLPIDKEYPEERMNYMLKDSRVKLLLTDHDARPLPGTAAGEIAILDIGAKGIYAGNTGNPGLMSRGTNLLYVIYTSGSTGQPKGVMLEHKSLVNLVNYQYKYTNIDFSRVLQFTTISFDVSAQEIFSTLLAGGRLSVIDKETRDDVTELFKVVKRDEIRTLFLATAFLRFIFKEKGDMGLIPASVRHIVAAGEQLIISGNLKEYLQESHVHLHNHYGPSETHVVTALTINPAEVTPGIPSIGRPVLNTSIFILDKDRCLLPIGIPGELYIGGMQVGRGYLNRPQLTAEKFAQDLWDLQDYHDGYYRSYSSHKSYIKYKTGDLARWQPDGNIEFLGRSDHQVKIRGFRIEPGEIENQLLKHKDIKEALVITREIVPGDTQICAYIVTQTVPGTPQLEVPALRDYLSGRLPGYMIPSYFLKLDKIPLTPNGKVDRKALPEPGIKRGEEYEAPTNRWEEILTGIWADILGVEKGNISINDNFFTLGGHSLKAIILKSRLHKEFNIKIPLTEIFKKPTIRNLAAVISAAGKEDFISMEKIEKKEYYEVSYNQRRIWVIDQIEPNNPAYNMTTPIDLPHRVCEAHLEEVLHKIAKRHESFRTGFKIVKNDPVQFVVEKEKILIKKIDLSSLSEKEKQEKRQEVYVDEVNTPFDLTRVPLFRSVLIKLEEERYEFIFNIHHIICDGWSMEILRQEFYEFYNARGKDIPGDKEPMPIQYKDYAAWQNRMLADAGKLGKAKAFWKNYLSGPPPVLNLPYDYSPGPGGIRSKKTSSYCLVIAEETTRELRSFARQQEGSLFMVLLVSFNILLSHITNQEEIITAVPAAARQHWELKPVIGMFVNTLLLHSRLDKEETFSELFHSMQNNIFNVLEYQDYPLELIFSELKMKYPEISVFFNMVNVGITQEEELTDFNPYHIEESQDTKFEMHCYLTEYKNAIKVSCHYLKGLFKPGTIEEIMNLYARILEDISKDPGKKVKEYCLAKKKRNISRAIKGGPRNTQEKAAQEQKIKTGMKTIQQSLSKVNMDFLDYVEKNPGCFHRSNFQLLELNDDLFRLQPWPTFINRENLARFREAGVGLFNLTKQIPGKVFNYDLEKMSAYYESPPQVINMLMEGITEKHIDSLVCRGDFLLSTSGLKCLEYNVTPNLGGWQIPIWESLYLDTPILARFLKEYGVKTRNKNLLGLLLEHFVGYCREKLSPNESVLNIALVTKECEEGEGESNWMHSTGDYLNTLYKDILQRLDKSLKGDVFLCDYPHLHLEDSCIFYKGKKIHGVIETYHGLVSPGVMEAFKSGTIHLFNGPITSLLSNKLNLAILSDPLTNAVFTDEAREIIAAYVPWTRKTTPGPTTYKGETIDDLEHFMLSRQQGLVIKPAGGYGGKGIRVGNKTPRDQWEKCVKTALREKTWVVQELVEASPGVYQVGNGYQAHDMAWGFFIFGSQYTGAWVRVMPRESSKGVINCHQGASVSITFEVDD